MFFQDLKSSVLNVFTHALTTQKISLLASQVHNLFVKLYSRDGGLTSDDSISYVFTFCLLCQTKDFLPRHFPLFHAAHPCCSVMHQTAFCTFCMLSRLLLARDPVSGDGGELCGLHLECCHILNAALLCNWQHRSSLRAIYATRSANPLFRFSLSPLSQVSLNDTF